MQRDTLSRMASIALGEMKSVRATGHVGKDAEAHLRRKHALEILRKYLVKDVSTFGEEASELMLFVSHDTRYSLNGGEKVLRAAKRIAKSRFGINAEAGGSEDSMDANILSDVIKRISKCDIFIAVMTPDQKNLDSEVRVSGAGLPSPWITLELGAALGLGKPVGVLLSDDVSTEYHDRLIPHLQRIHAVDLKGNFDAEFVKTLEYTLTQFANIHGAAN